jgi:hypothetical protein
MKGEILKIEQKCFQTVEIQAYFLGLYNYSKKHCSMRLKIFISSGITVKCD